MGDKSRKKSFEATKVAQAIADEVRENAAMAFITKENRMDDIKKLRVFTLTELEPIIGVTHRTLQSYVKDGKLKAVKIGGKWKVNEESLRAFLQGEY